MGADRRKGGRPGAGPAGAPVGGPSGPRRPASPASSRQAPGRGENRPGPSLVHSAKESTPSLRLRWDDVGRAFLFRPTLGNTQPPVPVYGPRFTTRLTPRAARKIKGAALKAHNLGFPLVTFMTFTCAPEDRELIRRGELVLGREMRRTLNAMQQRFRREGQTVFVYIWVAENPYDDNPHVHLLTNLRVPRSEFLALAAWVESLWGHGWVKIERIHKPKRAGTYILKAVGYSAKGLEGGQGRIGGNRYGISRNIATDESTADLYDREPAALTLMGLAATLVKGVDVEQLAEGVYLTRYGLAFGAGASLEDVGRIIDDLGEGVVPG